jgi:lactate permease
LLLLLKVWQPKTVLGYGGVELSAQEQETRTAATIGSEEQTAEGAGTGESGDPSVTPSARHSIWAAFLPFFILIIVVVLWTGPWSPLPKVSWFSTKVLAVSSINGKSTNVSFSFTPFIGGTSIWASWLIMLIFIRPRFSVLGQVFRDTFRQMWGALLVGVFIFGLAYVFNYSGMGASLATGFSKVGPWFILLAPILGWIGVALSGSNTSTNSLFGLVQFQVGKLLGFPLLLFPTLNSVGAEVGKPVAPQTASVGVSTSKYVRREGQVIRHNMGWTLVLLGWLILVGLLYYFFLPGFMS